MGFDWVDCGAEGKIRFAGLVRGGDELGHEIFEVSLPHHRSGLFGEYVQKWADNKNDFNIEIVRFGYLDQRNVDNLHPDAREKFSLAECATVQRLATALMNNAESQKGLSLFLPAHGHFLDHVRFAPDWIKLNE
jgi:hypothetical protein